MVTGKRVYAWQCSRKSRATWKMEGSREDSDYFRKEKYN